MATKGGSKDLASMAIKTLNKAIKNRPQKAVGWTRSARLLLRRYIHRPAWSHKDRHEQR